MFFCFKENLFQVTLILLLVIMLVYVTNITSIPDSIILFQDDKLNLETIGGVRIEEQTGTEKMSK